MAKPDQYTFLLDCPAHRYSEALGVIDNIIDAIVLNVRHEFKANSKYRLKSAEPFRQMILEGLEVRGFAVQPINPELLQKLKSLPLLGDGETYTDSDLYGDEDE